jgi:hypothetical protein
MHKELITAAFEKARETAETKGHAVPSTAELARRLSEYITDDYGFPFGERRLRDYYNEAMNEGGAEVALRQPEVVNALCKYLGYKDYAAYLASRSTDPKNRKVVGGPLYISPEGGKAQTTGKFKEEGKAQPPDITKKPSRSIRLTISISIIFLSIVAITWIVSQKETWMAWDGTHYVEMPFDAKGVQEGRLKVYKEDRILYFKRIDPDCSTEFFAGDGGVRLWYGKNKEGKLQYFTDLGLHPETGKTLKPITGYMIRKYVCPSY